MNEESTNDSGISAPPEELFDLLADKATFGLDETGTLRLDSLLKEYPWVRADYLDEAAAFAAIAFTEGDVLTGDVPDDVMTRISQGVHASIESENSAGSESETVLARIDPPAAPGTVGWLGWVAAAAAIAVAFVIARPIEPATPGSEAELVAWIDQHPEAIRWDWAPGLVEPDEDATGMVTFDPVSQEGYMLIKGLEPNDPRFQQYQLWIWDKDREPDPENPTPLADDVHPVDGGIFNVNDEGQAVIPIKAKLVIDQPYLFAVTVERPGGVAKSDKSQVPIIAGPPSDA